jgi:hypothetical protein
MMATATLVETCSVELQSEWLIIRFLEHKTVEITDTSEDNATHRTFLVR